MVLRRLVEADTNVCGLVVRDPHPPGSVFEPNRGELPVVINDMGPAVAVENDVPVIALTTPQDEPVLEEVRRMEPDILLVACFPMILDESWLGVPSAFGLNLHPSLLPTYRGPTPPVLAVPGRGARNRNHAPSHRDPAWMPATSWDRVPCRCRPAPASPR